MKTTSDAFEEFNKAAYKLFDQMVTSLYRGALFLFEAIPMAIGFALAAIREGFSKGEDLFEDLDSWIKK